MDPQITKKIKREKTETEDEFDLLPSPPQLIRENVMENSDEVEKILIKAGINGFNDMRYYFNNIVLYNIIAYSKNKISESECIQVINFISLHRFGFHEVLNYKPNKSCNSLMTAISINSEKIVQTLISLGVTIDMPDTHWRPIVLACQLKNPRMVNILINHNADVNSVYEEFTGAIFCAKYEKLDIMLDLCMAGAICEPLCKYFFPLKKLAMMKFMFDIGGLCEPDQFLLKFSENGMWQSMIFVLESVISKVFDEGKYYCRLLDRMKQLSVKANVVDSRRVKEVLNNELYYKRGDRKKVRTLFKLLSTAKDSPFNQFNLPPQILSKILNEALVFNLPLCDKIEANPVQKKNDSEKLMFNGNPCDICAIPNKTTLYLGLMDGDSISWEKKYASDYIDFYSQTRGLISIKNLSSGSRYKMRMECVYDIKDKPQITVRYQTDCFYVEN